MLSLLTTATATATNTMSTRRVRQVLDSMDSLKKSQLKKLLPKVKMPTDDTDPYPSAILSCFPKDNSYAYLGILAEHLLRLPSTEISMDTLCATLKEIYPELSTEAEAKIQKSITTPRFLGNLTTTRKALETVLKTDSPLEFEPEIVSGSLAGHPDMKNKTQVFEVKLTGMLKSNWSEFLFQVFSYGAILPDVMDLYLVLPLQNTVWHCDIRSWKHRTAYLEYMTKQSTAEQTDGLANDLMARILIETYRIGHHTKKYKTLAETIHNLHDYSKPYQIFLSGPMNSNISVDTDDLAAASSLVRKHNAQVYVHSQYLINLCAQTDDWNVKLLIKNLKYAQLFGCKGVVVHVGKSTTQTLKDALEKMREAITKAMESATEKCPILLETPAGQGSETLTKDDEFLEFVSSFKDPRVRMCLDTCHVFACGYKPLEFIKKTMTKDPTLLKLVHYNDSLCECGSKKDRHAFIGRGQIGLEKMTEIAATCSSHQLPMVIEM